MVRSPAPQTTPRIPLASQRQIARQDQVSKLHRQRERLAMTRRPLLDHLPLAVGGVTMRIAGLASDNVTTRIAIDAGSETTAHALQIYRAALHAYNDGGRAYHPELAP